MDALKIIGDRWHYGRLTISFGDGSRHVFGSGTPNVEWRLADRGVLNRIARDTELQLGETYVSGAWEVDAGQILPLFEVLMRNFPLARPRGPAYWLQAFWQRLRQWNPVDMSRRNAQFHYGREDELYQYFLDQDRFYSCAYFAEPGMSLEQAQRAKCHHIMNKLVLRPGMRVLDIGCGWGGLALYLAEHADVEVTGITPVESQQQEAARKAAARGFSERCRFLREDYRQHTESYDRIVSVGMFEHVGRPNYQRFFAQIERQLNPNGVALIHTIGSFTNTGGANRWLEKYVFPGTDCPLLSQMHHAVEQAGFITTDIEVLRLHYSWTLLAWLERLSQHKDDIVARWGPRFYRVWEFYLASCAASFRWRNTVVFQLQLSRHLDAVPVTRDYLYPSESLASPTIWRAPQEEQRSTRGDRRYNDENAKI